MTQVVSATIKSVQGTNPGPASGITYTLEINLPSGPITVPGVRPANSRPEGDIDIRAAAVNTHVIGTSDGTYHQFTIIEHPDYASCP